jgi:UDP-glucuronate 4-epimerase
MTIVVTGAAGFIGSFVVERLLSDGHQVIGLDNFDPFYARSIKESQIKQALAHPHFHLVELDFADATLLEQGLKGLPPVQALVHIGAKAGIRPSIENPVAYQRVNVQGTQNLLEWAKNHGVKQFVFASSSSVYGLNPRTPWSEEDAVLKPISPYASTKISGELLGHVYSHLYGIRFIALRFFTVYGPRQRPDLAIHSFANRIRERQPITLFGDGSTRRDYTYVDDIVNGVVAALQYEKSPYEVINLGNHQTVSLAEMVTTLERHLGMEAQRVYMPEQPGDVPVTYADIRKAERLLGYMPQVEFEEGIRRFCAWLQVGPR